MASMLRKFMYGAAETGTKLYAEKAVIEQRAEVMAARDATLEGYRAASEKSSQKFTGEQNEAKNLIAGERNEIAREDQKLAADYRADVLEGNRDEKTAADKTRNLRLESENTRLRMAEETSKLDNIAKQQVINLRVQLNNAVDAADIGAINRAKTKLGEATNRIIRTVTDDMGVDRLASINPEAGMQHDYYFLDLGDEDRGFRTKAMADLEGEQKTGGGAPTPTGRTAIDPETGDRLQEMSDGEWVPI